MNVVFASGYFFPQHFLGKDYFRGAATAFPDALFPVVPPLGDVKLRAQELSWQIHTRFPDGPIHIIAHSMAGLDARYLLSRNLSGLANPGRVASLSTISTPHHGSPIADFLVAPEPVGFDPRRIFYDGLLRLAAEFDQALGGLGDLTSWRAAAFNRDTPDVPHIRYHSYAGAGMESFALRLPHSYIASVGRTPDERENDGPVSVRSATWGELAETPWPTDHLGEVGYNLSARTLASAFDHIAAYRRILARAGR